MQTREVDAEPPDGSPRAKLCQSPPGPLGSRKGAKTQRRKDAKKKMRTRQSWVFYTLYEC